MRRREHLLTKVISICVCIIMLSTILLPTLNAFAAETTSAVTMQYYSSGNWHNFGSNGIATAPDISAIKLQTSSGAYYLQYRTQNESVSGFYSFVKSNVNDFAGTTSNKTIQKLHIQAYTNSNEKITSGIVVMYRIKNDGAWLPWVSNADAASMEAAQQEGNLGGTLDSSSYYAGASGKNAEAIQIRVFNIGNIPTNKGMDDYSEHNPLVSYSSHNSSAWQHVFNNTITSMTDCLKINTSSNKYYLSYSTKNSGVSSFYPEVSSADSNEYAGLTGKAIECLGIKVYTPNSVKLTTGVVVMYRVRVDGEWLPWVSNADPQCMEDVQAKYNLGGSLDTRGYYAGKLGKIATGIEIHIYEGTIPSYSSSVTGMSGNEYTPTIQYRIGSNTTFNSFSNHKVEANNITGLKIQTDLSKDYYLSYAVSRVGGGFYSEVSSLDNDFAGGVSSTPDINKIKIRVYNRSRVKLVTNVVVLYRVKVGDTWLDWVSNADPDWMAAVKIKYGITGNLDYNSPDAGLSSGTAISGIEIRIFEENNTDPISPSSESSKKISVGYINQNLAGYPTGCESVSTVMALKYLGYNISVKDFVNKYLPKKDDTDNFNPYQEFGGNPVSSTGMGCYAPAIVSAVNNLKNAKGYSLSVTNLTETSMQSLCSTYIDNNIPVIVWATIKMQKPSIGKQLTYGGARHYWIRPEHCLLLVGYDSNNYIFHDPLENAYKKYSKASVSIAYNGMMSQAVVIRKTGSSGGSSTPSTPSAPQIKPQTNPQTYTKPSPIKESSVADPIDVYSGAHTVNTTLLSLLDGQKISIDAGYNSGRLVSGSMGVGWYHNFEKRIETHNNDLWLYINPSVYCEYINSGNDTFECSSKGRNGYIITRQQNGDYLLNCNGNGTESYNSAGKLIKITDKQGFETNISYSENLITVTDSVTGRSLYLQSDSTDKIVRVYDNEDRQTILSYENDYLISITDANNNTIYYTYNNDGRLATGTDANDAGYFENTYDANGRIATQSDGVHPVTSFTYGENGNRTVTDRNGVTTYFVYDNDGQLTSYTDGNGNTTLYTYDENLNITSVTDALGNSETALYNSFNKPIRKSDKNGATTIYNYDTVGNLLEVLYSVKGDINLDGIINILDLVRLKKILVGLVSSYDSYNTDLNSDGVINAEDLTRLRQILLGIDENLNTAKETYEYNSRNQITKHTDFRNCDTVYTYDSNGMPSSITVGTKTATLSYANGRLQSETDYNGNNITYTYNNWGLVSAKTVGGQTTSYTYDNLGNVLSVTDSLGSTVSYTYDGNGQKVSETNANGNTTWYRYNSNLKIDTVTLANGSQIVYLYDNEDRETCVINPDGGSKIKTYDNVGNITKITDEDGNETEYEYDCLNRIVKETNAKGGETVYTYDANGNLLTANNGTLTAYKYDSFGNVIEKTDAKNGILKYSYNSAGDLLKETNALGNEVKYTYDLYGNRSSVTDARGNTTRYTYDNNNNLLTTVDALGNITTNTYNARNQIVTVTDAKNHTTTYGYDLSGRCISVTDARGNTTLTSYDSAGNVLSITDAKGNVISHNTYNESNLVETSSNYFNAVTSYEYDEKGNLSSKIDPLGNKTEYSYNYLGMTLNAKNAYGEYTSADYDALGNIISIGYENGGKTNYTYDNFGKVLTQSTPSGGTISYTYNSRDLKESVTNARNQSTTFTYDLVGRITGYTTPEGSVSYTYDANGNVLTVTDNNGTVTRTFDKLNRVSTYTDTYGNTISYSYDAVGNLATLTYPDNSVVNYTYDEDNNLVSVTDWSNRITSYTYDENNNLISIEKPDGSVTTNTYDNGQRLVSTVDRDYESNIISGYEYTYDNLDRILQEMNLADNTKICYTYDNLSRVIKRTVYDSLDEVLSSEDFEYDVYGNIITANADEHIYDINNRLVSVNNTAITYDLDGNMLSDGTLSYTYDSQNRLTSAGNCSYIYNAENVRIKKINGNDYIKYTYDTVSKLSRLLYSEDQNGNITKYIYGVGLIGQIATNELSVYHYDYRGSTVAITNGNGITTDTFEYDTYGKLISRTGTTDIPFRYNGRDGVITDENGLLYMRARYYNPNLQRFVNADILIGDVTDFVTLNRYAYANGNPVSNVDPFGLAVERNSMMNQLSKKDIDAGITITKIGGKYYYDYTTVVMNRLNEVLPDFYNHDILTYEEYIDEYSLKLFGKWIISVPDYDEYVASVLGSLWFFYDEVTHGAPWDIKRDKPWKQQFGDIRMPYYDGASPKNEWFAFRGETVTREDLGNITYGYLGSAMGIGDITLYWGGGVANRGLKNIFSEEVRNASKYYGDSKNDHYEIKKGIDFYYADYPNAKPGINRTIP